MIEGLPFLEFLAPGLVMMAVIQNAFANTSSSILIGKIQGNIVDMLMPPLRPGELLFGIVAGGVTRGLLVAVVVTLAMLPAVAIRIEHPLLVLYYALGGSLMLALLGLLGGIWAERFDQMHGDHPRGHPVVVPVRHLLFDRPATRAVSPCGAPTCSSI